MSKINYSTTYYKDSPYYVLTTSKLPILTSALAGSLALILVSVINTYYCSFMGAWMEVVFFKASSLTGLAAYSFTALLAAKLLLLGLVYIILEWGSELVYNESTRHFDVHTSEVQRGLLIGMALFLLSEAMLFFPFFWSFFHFSLSPTYFIGGVWPPVGISDYVLDPFMLPLVNTVLLLTSGVTLTLAHSAMLYGSRFYTLLGLFLSIWLGVVFSILQFSEYNMVLYSINDAVFGSVFFMLTGLHGFHVLVGATLLVYSLWSVWINTVSTTHHVFFECSAWYWHFVDVVWIFVFTLVYLLGIQDASTSFDVSETGH